MKYSILCIMLLAASPLTAQNQSKTKDEGCRPIPIGGGVSIWPENDCPIDKSDASPVRQSSREQKTAEYIRVPRNCKLQDLRISKRDEKEATITLKCVRPIILRDDYGRPRYK